MCACLYDDAGFETRRPDEGRQAPHSLEDMNLLRQVLTEYAEGNPWWSRTHVHVCTMLSADRATTLSFMPGPLALKPRAHRVLHHRGRASCYLVSMFFGRPRHGSGPSRFAFRKEVAKRRNNLLNYMLFLRITPLVPNTFVNVVSPVVDIPIHIFAFATCVGTLPQHFITAQMGLTLATVASFSELYDSRMLAFGLVAGAVILVPTFLGAEAGKSLKEMGACSEEEEEEEEAGKRGGGRRYSKKSV